MIKKILIVEDHPVALKGETLLMQQLGCQVSCAKTGEEAVELFKTHEYDLILMDIGLPGIDGIEATRQIRAFEQENQRALTPIVAVTGSIDQGERDRCLEAGMKDVSIKPLTMAKAQYYLQPCIDVARQLLIGLVS